MQISYKLMAYISMFIGTRQRMIPSPSADRPLHHRTIAIIITLLHAPPLPNPHSPRLKLCTPQASV